MKDYRQAFRFCVIKGTLSVGDAPTDWRITETEEAYQSREKAKRTFDHTRKALVPIATAMGTKVRIEDGILWYVEGSTGSPMVHYLRYEEIPLEKRKEPLKEDEEDLSGFGMPPLEAALSPVEERVLETGTCFLCENARIENREVRPSQTGEDEYTAEGSPKDSRHPMTFTRRRATTVWSRIRLTLEKARSTVFFGGLYPDELEDELRKRAVKLETPRKLYSIVRRVFWDQGVRSCSILIDSDWLKSEYEDWQHSLGWEPGNEDLPDYLSDYLNYRFLKEEGQIDERMTFRRYTRLREQRARAFWYDDDKKMDPSAASLPLPFLLGIDLYGTWDDSFPLLLKVYFNFGADVPEDHASRMQEANDELARAYLAFRQCDNLD